MRGRERLHCSGALIGVGLVALLGLAALARAEEVSRAEYVAHAEPICKANVLANKRIFKGAKAQVKAHKLKAASRHFTRAAAAFTRTIRQLEALPRPSADEAALAKWFGLLHAESGYVAKIGRSLAAGNLHKAESLSVLLNRNSTRANNAVLGFGFDYCRIDPARFQAG